jgi:hypothetical protein
LVVTKRQLDLGEIDVGESTTCRGWLRITENSPKIQRKPVARLNSPNLSRFMKSFPVEIEAAKKLLGSLEPKRSAGNTVKVSGAPTTHDSVT